MLKKRNKRIHTTIMSDNSRNENEGITTDVRGTRNQSLSPLQQTLLSSSSSSSSSLSSSCACHGNNIFRTSSNIEEAEVDVHATDSVDDVESFLPDETDVNDVSSLIDTKCHSDTIEPRRINNLEDRNHPGFDMSPHTPVLGLYGGGNESYGGGSMKNNRSFDFVTMLMSDSVGADDGIGSTASTSKGPLSNCGSPNVRQVRLKCFDCNTTTTVTVFYETK